MPPQKKKGRTRKLDLEQEFLMVMMMLRLDLFRFGVGDSTVTEIFITWIRLMSRQLPNHLAIKRSNLSDIAKLF